MQMSKMASLQKPQPVSEILFMGCYLGKSSFLALFPFSVAFAGLGYLIQPMTKPTFVDTTDWLALILFIMGSLVMVLLHAIIIYRMHAFIQGKSISYWESFVGGLQKFFPVLAVTILSFALITVGLMCFVIPGIYLAVTLSFASFLIVINGSKRHLSLNERVKESFLGSFELIRGNWWRTASVLLVLALASLSLETACLMLLQHQVVFAIIGCVLLRALLLPIWYASFFALLYDLRARSDMSQKNEKIPLKNAA